MGKVKQKEKNKKYEPSGITDNKLTAWQLRNLGYSVEQIAQILCVGRSTVSRWDSEVKDEFREMPGVRIAKDAMQALIPKAIKVYQENLESNDARVRRDTAKDILNNFEVLTEKTVVKHDTIKSDDELIAEAERIISGAKRETRSD